MKYHTHLLTLVGDGLGRWTFTPITNSTSKEPADANADGDVPLLQPDAPVSPMTPGNGPAAGDLIRVLEEIQTLEKQLEEAKVWEARVRELEEALQVREGDASQGR